MVGGLVSYAVSYQQIREARGQRAEDASQERQRRSEDRRFTAYAEIISHRAVQNALHFYYPQAARKPGLHDIDELLQAGYNSSAMVFLVAETERTSNACAEVLRILHHTHDLIHQNASNPAEGSTRAELNVTLGRTMREFENAARAELGVRGPEWTFIERRQPDQPRSQPDRPSWPGNRRQLASAGRYGMLDAGPCG